MITWAERVKASIARTGQNGTAKTDETAVNKLLSVSAVTTVDGYAKSEGLSSVLTVASSAILEKHDRWCWPHSSAMNGGEIELFQARSVRFAERGLSGNESEAMAEKLVARDRDADDRRFCLECKHFSGYSQASWRCGNWPTGGIAIRMRERLLPADFVLQLQRCDGFFTHSLNSTATPFRD